MLVHVKSGNVPGMSAGGEGRGAKQSLHLLGTASPCVSLPCLEDPLLAHLAFCQLVTGMAQLSPAVVHSGDGVRGRVRHLPDHLQLLLNDSSTPMYGKHHLT